MSRNIISPRYQPTYRADEINLIIRFALRGESLGFVGIAGIGKSNLVNFLRDIQGNAQHIEQDVERLHFPVVDATYWQRTPISLWKMMLEALNQATKELEPSSEANKVIPILEEERVLSTLQARLEWICQELKHKIMFVLDDFDVVFQTGPLAMLERLNGLRSEGNRGALSYLVFTKRLPHILGQNYHLENGSKFYDLFRHNIYALEPYAPEDARQMLIHLNEVAGKPLNNRELTQIRALAGGHAQLLKIVFNIWVNEGVPNATDPVTHLAAKPDVQQECRRILLSLHEQEQVVALLVAQGRQTADYQDIIDHLVRRGLLSAPTTWFSPLFAQFLSTYAM
jgi:hypothetical protein